MDNLDATPPINATSRHRFAQGDEVTLPCGSVGVVQMVLQANHYRIVKTATGEAVVEHDFSLVGKAKRPAASPPRPTARRTDSQWQGTDRRQR